ncbi:hypothetical protein BGZ57DRAFT_773060 [Hyaloscypha finlandica]|nr:hypothetical protein F5882DRAFT_312571 [Hyaloscypha sp. PMI_1271]KAH8754974.1 hypothetical protein BGZ57DRAFT_773060 [Hyaloscypha finlandica]
MGGIHYSSVQSIFDELNFVDDRPIWSSIQPIQYAITPTSPEELQAKYSRIDDTWKGKPAFSDLTSLFGDANVRQKIKKIVCFGLGTMQQPHDMSARSFLQHAIIKSIADALGGNVPIFLQDPAYTGNDTNLVSGLGMTVVNDPKGFLQVDTQTLVVAVAPDIPLRQIIADLAEPAAMIWKGVVPPEEEAIAMG